MGNAIARRVSGPQRFYVDASIPIAVAKALDLVRPDIEYPGKPGCPVTGPEVKDPVWLPLVGGAGWAVLMRDKKTKHRPLERAAVKAYGLRAFTFASAGNLTRWATLLLMVQKWGMIETIINSEPGPFLYSITKGAPRRIRL